MLDGLRRHNVISFQFLKDDTLTRVCGLLSSILTEGWVERGMENEMSNITPPKRGRGRGIRICCLAAKIP
jgi:hypothetical protein